MSSVPFTQGGIRIYEFGFGRGRRKSAGQYRHGGERERRTPATWWISKNNLVLQTVAGFNSPQAVAVNPITNTAYIVNQGNNTVSVFPMATTTPNPLQILESSPLATFVQSPAAGLTLSIIGNGFTGGSQVLLDGTAVPATFVNSRQVTAAIPAVGPHRGAAFYRVREDRLGNFKRHRSSGDSACASGHFARRRGCGSLLSIRRW